MKTRQLFFLISLMGAVCMMQSCARNSDDVWEDTKSAGRHLNRGVRALTGSYEDSRQVRSRSDFESIEDENYFPEGNFQDCDYQDDSQENYGNNQPNDFVPLHDPSNELGMAAMISAPPHETPGEQGSSIPGIQMFRDPSTIPQLVGIFRPIYFDYDSSMIKGPQNLQTLHAIADFLRDHQNIYLFIEGHTDERGPQAYNLALGSRRSNTIRNLLINEGVNPDHLFTISYGKERPVILERHEEGWARNRRAEFKIYER
jgi:peptidoglycan-associated lipoprotein